MRTIALQDIVTIRSLALGSFAVLRISPSGCMNKTPTLPKKDMRYDR